MVREEDWESSSVRHLYTFSAQYPEALVQMLNETTRLLDLAVSRRVKRDQMINRSCWATRFLSDEAAHEQLGLWSGFSLRG